MIGQREEVFFERVMGALVCFFVSLRGAQQLFLPHSDIKAQMKRKEKQESERERVRERE